MRICVINKNLLKLLTAFFALSLSLRDPLSFSLNLWALIIFNRKWNTMKYVEFTARFVNKNKSQFVYRAKCKMNRLRLRFSLLSLSLKRSDEKSARALSLSLSSGIYYLLSARFRTPTVF